jgi:uncharacterized cupredoxin-like copper-binding protein
MRLIERLRGRRGGAMAVIGLVVAIAMGSAGCMAGAAPYRVEITIHFSHFDPNRVTVPAGRQIQFVIHNLDPIDHEWILGDAQTHAVHRTGTEAHHGDRPNEVTIAALADRTTTLQLDQPRTDLTFVCHLPGHEAYGMVGLLVVEASG